MHKMHVWLAHKSCNFKRLKVYETELCIYHIIFDVFINLNKMLLKIYNKFLKSKLPKPTKSRSLKEQTT